MWRRGNKYLQRKYRYVRRMAMFPQFLESILYFDVLQLQFHPRQVLVKGVYYQWLLTVCYHYLAIYMQNIEWTAVLHSDINSAFITSCNTCHFFQTYRCLSANALELWRSCTKPSIIYSDITMSAVASQITGVSIVYSTICSGTDQRNYQSSASLAFVRVIHRWPVNSPHKGPVTRKMFPFDDVNMIFYLQKSMTT